MHLLGHCLISYLSLARAHTYMLCAPVGGATTVSPSACLEVGVAGGLVAMAAAGALPVHSSPLMFLSGLRLASAPAAGTANTIPAVGQLGDPCVCEVGILVTSHSQPRGLFREVPNTQGEA